MIPAAANGALWIAITLGLFFGCRAIYMHFTHSALHPVLWTTIAVVALVFATHHSVASFAVETGPLVWLLGPAVVAMAVPVWQKRQLIIDNWRMFGAMLGVSLAVAAATILLLPALLDQSMAQALAIKSVTAPVALGIARETGLRQDLVVVGVMTSGLVGMLVGPALLAFFGLKGDRPELGTALGCASHGLGTAKAFEIGKTAGAFASVSMGLSALAYGVLLPLLLTL